MSRPRVNESSEWDFIKVILTNNQGRSEEDKKQMQIRKNRCIKQNRTHYCIEKFNMAFSLYRVLKIALYFPKGFLEVTVRGSAVAEAL